MKKSKIKITKKSTFKEILEKCPEVIGVFASFGMHCIGCPASPMETIEQGCKMHGINPEELIKKLKEKCGKNG